MATHREKPFSRGYHMCKGPEVGTSLDYVDSSQG